MFEPLTELEPGMAIVYGGDRITRVDDSLARAFRKGDRLVVVQETGDLLHIPEDDWLLATRAIDSAYAAFSKMGSVPQDQLSAFFNRFADNLGDDEVFEQILSANRGDVERATARGRSTTRLLLTEPMRRGMIEGLRAWVGFKQIGVSYRRAARYAGETKYPFRKMVRLALNAITSFSYLPLQVATFFGFISAGIAIIGIPIVIVLRVSGSPQLTGQATTLIAVLFLGGVQLISLGILGEYVGRLYDEAKGRPLYIVREAPDVKG